MAWNKETALAAQVKSKASREGNSAKVSKAEMLELISARLRNAELRDSRFVALTNAWMILTGRSAKKTLPLNDVASDGDDDMNALVKKLEKEKQNG
jgi:hypothetical protein